MLPTINQDFFKPALQYNQQNIEKIHNICNPLKQSFNITTFAYFRLLNNGQYISLSNNPKYQEIVMHNDYFYSTEYLSNHPQLLSKYKSNDFIWPENIKDEGIEKLYAQNMRYIFNVTRENKNTLEFYLFCAGKNYPFIRDFYDKCSHVLKDFITHFNTLAGELIDSSDVKKQGQSPYLKETYSQIEDIFKASTLWEKNIIEFNSLRNSSIRKRIYEVAKENSLTFQELQCLFHLSRGKTAKETARALNIGPRTVETHNDRIRKKTSCHTKNELTEWFKDTFKYFLEDLTIINER